MEVFWQPIIRPIFDILLPKSVVEIGIDKGDNTKHLLEYCKKHNGFLHGIDPERNEITSALEAEYSHFFKFYEDLSLNTLPKLESYDAILIDGDHNWYTVYHELILIEKCAQKQGTFPMVFIHDVGWPYGKRDMYFNAEIIPEKYRQMHKKGGLQIDNGIPQDNNGFNAHFDHALYEHGIQNGVLSAMEDFLKQTEFNLTSTVILGFHGLGILCDKKILDSNSQLKKLLNGLDCPQELKSATIAVEQDRIKQIIYNNELLQTCSHTRRQLENEQREKQERELMEKQEQELREKQEQELREKQERELREKQEQELREKQERELREKQEQELREKQERELREKQEQELRAKQEQELREKQERELREKLERELKDKEAQQVLWTGERKQILKNLDQIKMENSANKERLIQRKRLMEENRTMYIRQITNLEINNKNKLEEERSKNQNHTTELEEIITQEVQKNAILSRDIQHILKSKSWRWTHFLRVLDKILKWPRTKKPLYWLCANLKDIWTDFDEPFPKLVRFIRHNILGCWLPSDTQNAVQPIQGDAIFYNDKYLSTLNTLKQKDLQQSNEAVNNMHWLPSIHIVIFVELLDEIRLRKTLNSIVEQTYYNWNITVLDASKSYTSVQSIVKDYSIHYPEKIKYIRQHANQNPHIEAIENNKSTYVSFMDSTNTLQHDALERLFTAAIEEANLPDLIYSDHDELHCSNASEYTPVFKPGWSPELLLSYNYIGAFFLIKHSMLLKCIDNTNIQEQETFAYDLLLRIAEHDPAAIHIPQVLWRQSKSFVITSQRIEAHRSTLQKALARRGLKHRIEYGEYAQKHNEIFFSIKSNFSAKEEPTVTIIIPTKDRAEMLKNCINSITKKTDYKRYKILIVDNGSEELATKNYLQSLTHTVLKLETKQFNFAYINNRAVQNTDTELLLFLNNDTEILNEGWLREMVGTMSLDKNIGAVGSKLLYPEGAFPYRVQSAGAILGRHWSSLVKFKTEEELGYGFYNHVMRNCAIVSGSCMLTKRNLFAKVGGFDTEKFGIDFNDVDYCLKLMQEGYRTVWTPHARILHHLSASRGSNNGLGANVVTKESKAFERKWGWLFGHDPYYNCNFSLDIQDDAFTPRTRSSFRSPYTQSHSRNTSSTINSI
ncbi:MAG: glycosyltransferase [Kiritimatiellales bacterium]|nr:glycosyltransferase [Kiritimatiellales bacterium]